MNRRVLKFAAMVALCGLPFTPAMLVQALAAEQTTAAITLRVTATVKPNAPRIGDNAIDLYITDAQGRPVTGIKLSARVFMTSMDMGTTKPEVKETGNGHYTVTVAFN